jgi:hypothetical protein
LTKIYHFDRIVKNYLPLIGSASVKLFLAQALAEDRDAGSEPFGGRWGRGMPQQAGCVAQGVTEHFQAKWLHLAARKMRSNKQVFSSQVVTLGDSESATKQTIIFKPSGHTWRLGKNVQNSVQGVSHERM